MQAFARCPVDELNERELALVDMHVGVAVVRGMSFVATARWRPCSYRDINATTGQPYKPCTLRLVLGG